MAPLLRLLVIRVGAGIDRRWRPLAQNNDEYRGTLPDDGRHDLWSEPGTRLGRQPLHCGASSIDQCGHWRDRHHGDLRQRHHHHEIQLDR